jgi:hypothetical protein
MVALIAAFGLRDSVKVNDPRHPEAYSTREKRSGKR